MIDLRAVEPVDLGRLEPVHARVLRDRARAARAGRRLRPVVPLLRPRAGRREGRGQDLPQRVPARVAVAGAAHGRPQGRLARPRRRPAARRQPRAAVDRLAQARARVRRRADRRATCARRASSPTRRRWPRRGRWGARRWSAGRTTSDAFPRGTPLNTDDYPYVELVAPRRNVVEPGAGRAGRSAQYEAMAKAAGDVTGLIAGANRRSRPAGASPRSSSVAWRRALRGRRAAGARAAAFRWRRSRATRLDAAAQARAGCCCSRAVARPRPSRSWPQAVRLDRTSARAWEGLGSISRSTAATTRAPRRRTARCCASSRRTSPAGCASERRWPGRTATGRRTRSDALRSTARPGRPEVAGRPGAVRLGPPAWRRDSDPGGARARRGSREVADAAPHAWTYRRRPPARPSASDAPGSARHRRGGGVSRERLRAPERLSSGRRRSSGSAARYRRVRDLNTLDRPMEERTTYEKAFLQVMNLWREREPVRAFVFGRRLARHRRRADGRRAASGSTTTRRSTRSRAAATRRGTPTSTTGRSRPTAAAPRGCRCRTCRSRWGRSRSPRAAIASRSAASLPISDESEARWRRRSSVPRCPRRGAVRARRRELPRGLDLPPRRGEPHRAACARS